LIQRYINIPNTFIYFDISPFVNEPNAIQFTLANKDKFNFDIGYLADQIEIYPKAKYKLPSFTECYAIFTPQSYEQSSSESIALFKAGLFSGKTMLDLSGGLGVDNWAFAKSFDRVDSIDIDGQLNKVVRRNFEKLGVNNIHRYDADAYGYVDNVVNNYDCIYMDADRRSGANRAFALKDTEPNIFKIKDKLFKITDKVLLKVSPMLDLSALVNELETVKQIWVIALKNEVKEILLELTPKPSAQIKVQAVNIEEDETEQFDGVLGEKDEMHFGNKGKYFYEPSLALIKAGLATNYFAQCKINQLAGNSVYGVSDDSVNNFFGRSFEIIHQQLFSKSKFAEYIKQRHLEKANIAKRNFKMEVTEIRKVFKLKDGGEDYLFFTEDSDQQKLFFHCRKIRN
jgi:hypothetical protein